MKEPLAVAWKEPRESWRRAWRDGFFPQFTTAGLAQLEKLVLLQRTGTGEPDDGGPVLAFGVTAVPEGGLGLGSPAAEAAAVCGACAITVGACGGLLTERTVGQAESAFLEARFVAGKLLGDWQAASYFTSWWDGQPDLRAFLGEVRACLEVRRSCPSRYPDPALDLDGGPVSCQCCNAPYDLDMGCDCNG
jgi:hypothetical protein